MQRKRGPSPSSSARKLSDQIATRVAALSPSFKLFNGSVAPDDWVKLQFANYIWWLPPQASGTHPGTGETKDWDGTVEIKDVLGIAATGISEGDWKRARNPATPRTATRIQALHALPYFLQHFESRGVRLLTGGPEDVKTRHEARLAWVRWYYERCSETVALFNVKVRKAVEGNPALRGRTLRMDERERQAQEFMEAVHNGEYELVQADAAAYECKQDACGFSTDSEKAMDRHLRITHRMSPDDVKRALAGERIDEPARTKSDGQQEEHARPRRGRPPKPKPAPAAAA